MKRYLSILLSLLMILSTVPVFGAATLLPNPNPQFFSNTGVPCSGCKLYFYENNTSTEKDTYISSAMTTTNANPVVLNSRGEATSGIWLDGTYSVTLKTSAGSTIWGPKHDIRGVADLSALDGAGLRWIDSALTPAYVAATQFSVSGDQTALFHVGRRLKIVVTAGTVYGIISASSYAASVTTVTVTLDSGSLDSGISTVYYSLEAATNSSLSVDMLLTGTTFSHSNANYFGGNINSIGTVTFSGDIKSTGTVSFSGSLTSLGTHSFSGTQNISGNISSSGTSTFTGMFAANNANAWVKNTQSLLMSGETYSSGTVNTKTADMGSVTAGDRILFFASCGTSYSSAGNYNITVSNSAGTATTTIFNPTNNIYAYTSGTQSAIHTLSGMVLVTGTGTLTLQAACTVPGGGASTTGFYAVHLKKQ